MLLDTKQSRKKQIVTEKVKKKLEKTFKSRKTKANINCTK